MIRKLTNVGGFMEQERSFIGRHRRGVALFHVKHRAGLPDDGSVRRPAYSRIYHSLSRHVPDVSKKSTKLSTTISTGFSTAPTVRKDS